MTEPPSLAGCKVLVTRAPDRARAWTEALSARGATVVARETFVLETMATDDAARAAVETLEGYAWILVTSANGLRFLCEALEAAGRSLAGLKANFGVVGPQTAAALQARGVEPAVVATRADSGGLAAALADRIGAATPVLVVRPEVSRPELVERLTAMGAAVDSVPFYRNRPAPSVGGVARELLGGAFHVAVFSSPSSFNHLVDAGSGRLDGLAGVALVAIGETTAAAIRARGHAVAAVARRPTPEGIADAVAEALRDAPVVLPSPPFSRGRDQNMTESQARRTPLYERHLQLGARMVPFAGWEMPVQYGGLIDEHMAVRQRAGLFDVSHMGEARVRGPQACDFLQYVTCNNVAKLKVGRAHYTGLMTPTGCFHDDLLIYRLADDDFLLVLNAANAAKDIAWLHEHSSRFDATVEDDSDAWALIALQGPAAVRILEPLAEAPVDELAYYGFAHVAVAGVDALVSRTGYTGEDGFELYVPSGGAGGVWDALIDGGGRHGLLPTGLGARDTLRLEAAMALYGNDIDDTTTALEAGLGWIVKLKKGDFIGRDALLLQKAEGLTRKLVGFEMEGRAIARHGYDACVDGKPVGRVTSGTLAPFLNKRIGLAYLPIEMTEVGTPFQVDVRGRPQPARVVDRPFYKRDKP